MNTKYLKKRGKMFNDHYYEKPARIVTVTRQFSCRRLHKTSVMRGLCIIIYKSMAKTSSFLDTRMLGASASRSGGVRGLGAGWCTNVQLSINI